MLLSNNCVNNNKRDNFIRRRTIERSTEEIEAKMQEINERLHKLGTRLIACVDTKVDNGIKEDERKWTKTTL